MIDVELSWRPSALALSLATTSATALALAAVFRRPELVAFAAPLLGALIGGARGGRPAGRVRVGADRDTERCFENETVRVHVTVDPGGDELVVLPAVPDGLELLERASGPRETWFTVRAVRWGRFPLTVRVSGRAAGGLLVGSATAAPAEVRVYPRPAPLRAALRPDHLPDRIGVHIGRRRGEGVEFAGIRPYVAGDQLGRLNWAASARLGRLHITERLAERAADVVALVDTYPLAGTDRSSLDLAVHGAAEIAQAALRRGDRAGVLALGGPTRWLGPDIGRRQFYRIADAVLDVAPAVPTQTTGGRVPRSALPPGAFVVAFTPLLDARIGLALQDVRGRGHAILVVDVLRRAPHAALDPLVARLWRLERRALHRDLASLGIPVVLWDESSTLDEVLYPLARRPLSTGRPPR